MPAAQALRSHSGGPDAHVADDAAGGAGAPDADAHAVVCRRPPRRSPYPAVGTRRRRPRRSPAPGPRRSAVGPVGQHLHVHRQVVQPQPPSRRCQAAAPGISAARLATEGRGPGTCSSPAEQSMPGADAPQLALLILCPPAGWRPPAPPAPGCPRGRRARRRRSSGPPGPRPPGRCAGDRCLAPCIRSRAPLPRRWPAASGSICSTAVPEEIMAFM